jgi:hypothetical protein
MKRKPIVLVSIASALASLTGAAQANVAPSSTPEETPALTNAKTGVSKLGPNVIFNAGQDLLGLLVTQNADGTVVAQHESHYSHSSHASHASHVSGL